MYGLRSSLLSGRRDDRGMASGCPLNNLVPEWNDLVYLGNWEHGLQASDQDELFSGVHIQSLPGSV